MYTKGMTKMIRMTSPKAITNCVYTQTQQPINLAVVDQYQIYV